MKLLGENHFNVPLYDPEKRNSIKYYGNTYELRRSSQMLSLAADAKYLNCTVPIVVKKDKYK